MQNDFLVRDGYYHRKNALKAKAGELGRPTPQCRHLPVSRSHRRLIDDVCKAVAAARARRWPVVFLQAVYSQRFRVKPRFLLEDQNRSYGPCQPRTSGAELVRPIARLARRKAVRDTVIVKHTFDGFHGTKLKAFLRHHHVRSVLVVGVETHACVLVTSMRAGAEGFRSMIIKDCVRTARRDLARPALKIFRDAFGRTATLAQVLRGAV